MYAYINAVVTGLIVGVGGIAGGAAVTLAVKTAGKRLPSALMGLAGGIMLVTVAMDMLPHALEHGSWHSVLFWLAVGAVATVLAARFVPHIDGMVYDEATMRNMRSTRLTRSGLLLAVGVAIHNLPQGIALGSGVTADFAFLLGLLLLLHNVPEGMAMCVPLKIGGVPARIILKIAVLAALPTCLGAVIGVAVSSVSYGFISGSTAFASGSMLYLTLTELIPQSVGLKKGFYPVAFLLLGAAVSALVITFTHTH